jgi:hypothetical protein
MDDVVETESSSEKDSRLDIVVKEAVLIVLENVSSVSSSVVVDGVYVLS